VTRHADRGRGEPPQRPVLLGQGREHPGHAAELNEFFGSMIAMDDPRHARLRSIVSRGFTPKALARLSDDVERRASGLVDAIIERASATSCSTSRRRSRSGSSAT
jgi:cytochrome P450